jgi:hypothetical protein
MATYLPNVTDVFPKPVTYTPDFSYMDKMLRRRQSMYEQGYAQVAGKYAFLNREVTNGTNREFRDKFLQQAVGNLKNLSAMDLSISQNVQAAASVFEPFYKNKNALGDMALTEHWNQQEAIAETYRLKDGGKEYSDDNVNFIRLQRQEFANGSADSWSSFYGNRRYYNPYYDYNKEVKDVMKDFKPSNYQTVKLQGLYKITEQDASWREAEIRRYLDATLSDKAKKQMRIESTVRLASSPEALTSIYGEIASKEIQFNNLNIQQIDKDLALEKDPEKIKLLKDYKKKLEDNNAEVNTTLDNLKKGDPEYIKSNADRLAFQIYFNQSVNKWSKGFSHDDNKVDITADQAAIAVMQEQGRDRRAAMAEDRADRRTMMELEGLPGDYNLNEVRLTEQDVTLSNVTERYQKQVDQLNSGISELTLDSKRHILEKVNEGKPQNEKLKIEAINEEFVRKWLQTGGPGGKPVPKTDLYYTNLRNAQQLVSQRNALQNTLNTIDEAGLKGLSEKEQAEVKSVKNVLQKMGSIKTDDGTIINVTELFNGIKNGTIKPDLGWFSNTGSVKINGKTYQLDDRTSGKADQTVRNNVSLLNAIVKINGLKGNDAYSSYTKSRQSYIDQNFQALRMSNKVVSFSENDKRAKSLEASVGTYLPPGFDVKHFGVGTTALNGGNAYFYITPKSDSENSSSPEDIVALMKEKGADVSFTKTEGGGVLFEVKGLNNRVTNQFRSFSPGEQAVVSELMNHTGSGSYQSSSFTTPYGDTNFLIKKSNGKYYLYVGSNPYSYDTYEDPSDAIYAARLLSSNNGERARMFDNFTGN